MHGTGEDVLQGAEDQAALEEGLGETVHPQASAHVVPPTPSTLLVGKRRSGAGKM